MFDVPFNVLKQPVFGSRGTSPGADPEFPVGGGANPLGGANIRFCQIFRKTARNRENFGPCTRRPPPKSASYLRALV